MSVRAVRVGAAVLTSGLLCVATTASAQSTLWASSSEGSNPASIYTIDSATGTATLVGPVGLVDSANRPNKVSAVAVDPDGGTLYGMFGSACTGARLITIDQASGAGTSIGYVTGMGFNGALDTGGGLNQGGNCHGGSDALAFGNDAKLYAGAWNGGTTSGGRLLTINKNTGAVLSNVATTGGAHIAGLAVDGNGTLWVSRGNNTAGQIHTINPATGQFLSTIPLSDSNAIVSDIAFGADGSTLYGAMPDAGNLVKINTTNGNIEVIGAFGGGAKIAGLARQAEVLAETCANPEGCNPTGGQTIQLPQTVLIPEGATISQKKLTLTDPRANPDGTCDHEPLVLFQNDPANPLLIIPEYLCGSPDFVLLLTQSDLTFTAGALTVTNDPEVFFGDAALPCDQNIVGDPQQQDVMVWQPDDAGDVLEGHAIELTFECGSSRGKTKGLSYFIVGMHIDFGMRWDGNKYAIRRAFVDLTDQKFHFLTEAILDAKRVLPRRDFSQLVVAVGLARIAFKFRLYHIASHKVDILLRLVDRARFDSDDPDNNQGNIDARASNVKFMIDEKIIGLSH